MKRGRKPIDISQEEFEKLCALQCRLDEIASWFRCSIDTIERWCKRTYGKKYAEVFAEKRGAGRIALRRYQWQLAQKNPAMAIFLGKQFLDQSDRREYEVSGKGGGPVAMKIIVEFVDGQPGGHNGDPGKLP